MWYLQSYLPIFPVVFSLFLFPFPFSVWRNDRPRYFEEANPCKHQTPYSKP